MISQVSNQESLEQIFGLLREGKLPESLILELLANLNSGDVPWIMKYVQTLRDPGNYMDDLDEYDPADNAKREIIVRGFFNFIDLISALIMKIGCDAIEELKKSKRATQNTYFGLSNIAQINGLERKLVRAFLF